LKLGHAGNSHNGLSRAAGKYHNACAALVTPLGVKGVCRLSLVGTKRERLRLKR
jgi:hypothetical protein